MSQLANTAHGKEGSVLAVRRIARIATTSPRFAVGLAYLIPQWVGAPGVLKPSATVVEATDKIQFVSALVVAIPAGVGFDTVLEVLHEREHRSGGKFAKPRG
jgi:hypothetical protein